MIRAAAAITDTVMGQVNELVAPGQRESELAWELEKMMRDAGATGLAFDITVASGPNAAMSHHKPGNRKLQAGDALIVDMGAELNGYKSDLTRTFYLGDEPDDTFWAVYNLALLAHGVAMAGGRAGMTGKAIDDLARAVIRDGGHGDNFGHSLGHGVGLEIHEAPRLSFRADNEIVSSGSVVTLEPGIYVEGWGGVRIEDLVLATAEGLESISRCPKEPRIPISH
jgi:Xaa-Pro aminopeptidase